jgi:hypothetical protein
MGRSGARPHVDGVRRDPGPLARTRFDAVDARLGRRPREPLGAGGGDLEPVPHEPGVVGSGSRTWSVESPAAGAGAQLHAPCLGFGPGGGDRWFGPASTNQEECPLLPRRPESLMPAASFRTMPLPDGISVFRSLKVTLR